MVEACVQQLRRHAPFVDSRLPCVTTAGDVAMGASAAGTTNTPTLSNDTVCPPCRCSDDEPDEHVLEPHVYHDSFVGAKWDVLVASILGCRRAVGGNDECTVVAQASFHG
eukprot:6187224-Pleurochrysis_carterae.AAC.1